MLRKFIYGIFAVCNYFVVAQTHTYNDVAVIINLNSAISDSIGNYFIAERGVPMQNRIYVSSPVSEEIDSVQFQVLRSQIESYLTTNNIADSINYLVTTKGVPLKIKRSDLMNAASVESELSLILGPYSDNIQKYGVITSPYYLQRNDFTHARYGIYLVTRLDGYTYADIKRIIDQSGSIGANVPVGGQYVFDQDPTWNDRIPNLNDNMRGAAAILTGRGMNVLIDNTTTFLTGQQNVLGYAGWGSNDRNHSLNGLLNNTWMPGAIAETYVSTSARTFTSPAVYGQSLIADLIAEGITAAKGYVYEPYSSAIADVSVLFDLYTNGYTIAESYYSASPYLSWMDVIIGDPKYRLISSRLPADVEVQAMPVELTFFRAEYMNNKVTLTWKTATEVNNYGFEVERKTSTNWDKVGFVEGNGTTNAPHLYLFNDSNVEGKTTYRLKQIDRDGKVEYSKETIVIVSEIPQQFVLKQNYPNPFNSSTMLRYGVSERSTVKLSVYTTLGQLVSHVYSGTKDAGFYEYSFDASQLSSGIYLYRIEAVSQQNPGKTFVQTKKMVLMR
jgi:uncharacterized protein (TIGR03790 family)